MIPEKKSIAIMKELSIGNTKQMLMINGVDVKNPLLLFLHGGPGTPQIGYVRHYQKELEQYFTVVHWDQRGSGLSYSKRISHHSMTIDHFIKDTIQVTQWLLAHFSKSKLYLAGHSWGQYWRFMCCSSVLIYFTRIMESARLLTLTMKNQLLSKIFVKFLNQKKPAYYLSSHVSLVLRLGSRISSTLSIGFVSS
ncbi:alpha/beta fold hydrolase [Bacillus subtilis]|uniref:alpha/beta fold hydrolase n=1 Tax=Bacillus subtilis TaxID=1423 RepID=UPI003306AC6A